MYPGTQVPPYANHPSAEDLSFHLASLATQPLKTKVQSPSVGLDPASLGPSTAAPPPWPKSPCSPSTGTPSSCA